MRGRPRDRPPFRHWPPRSRSRPTIKNRPADESVKQARTPTREKKTLFPPPTPSQNQNHKFRLKASITNVGM
jgi:hypothetical protein